MLAWRLIAVLAAGVIAAVAATPYGLHGLTRSYYDNAGWLGQAVSTVRDRTLRLQDADFPWYGSWYSVEWAGVIYVPDAGHYRFELASDDGSWLWIDGTLVVDNGGMHSIARVGRRVYLASGFRKLRLRYMQAEGDVAFSVSWRPAPSAGVRSATVPLRTAMLFPDPPSPAMFAAYRIGWALGAARGELLLGLLVSVMAGGVWRLTRRRSGRPRPPAAGVGARAWLARALLLVGSLALALGGVEIALRILYRDNGRTTSDGPGGSPFIHSFPPWSTDRNTRGPSADGPKPPGVTRVLVQGDSITWGQGVSDWTLLYPVRLLEKLRETGEYDMAVLARPGRNIDEHVSVLEQVADRLTPDIVVYQWFVNDIVPFPQFVGYLDAGGRPPLDERWRQWRYHETARARSFLYWLLHRRVSDLLGSQLYIDYLHYFTRDGTSSWQSFRTWFHRWATRATARANRVVLLQYPMLPFRGNYPLADVHQRVASVAAGPSVWSQPAYTAAGRLGTIAPTLDSRYGVVRKAPRGARGELAAFRGLPFRRGRHEATFWLRLMDEATGIVARAEIKSDDDRLGVRRIRARDFAVVGEWQAFTVGFDVERELAEDVALRVVTLGRGGIEVDAVDLMTDYGIEVVDATAHLRDFDTWASPFDAHPNGRAHAVLADVLYERLIVAPRQPPQTSTDRAVENRREHNSRTTNIGRPSR